MRKFTADEIKAQFDNLPMELREAITSPEINKLVEDIAKRHGLQIDQLGELIDLVGFVMLGLVPSRDFVRLLSEEAGIDNDLANTITNDVNSGIFNKIRTSIREIEEREIERQLGNKASAKPEHITELEKAGDFTIEHETAPLVTAPTSKNAEEIGTNVQSSTDNASGIGNTVENAATTPTKSENTTSLETSLPKTIAQENAIEQPVSKTTDNLPNNQEDAGPVAVPEESSPKEPLAGQLLDILNKHTQDREAGLVPDNLPTEEESATTPPPVQEPAKIVEIRTSTQPVIAIPMPLAPEPLKTKETTVAAQSANIVIPVPPAPKPAEQEPLKIATPTPPPTPIRAVTPPVTKIPDQTPAKISTSSTNQTSTQNIPEPTPKATQSDAYREPIE